MSLVAYKKKRHFSRTPEPAGKLGSRQEQALRFVIQKHDASRLHYDFRLELDGVLKSWAVPKGPSLDPERKVLAVQVEDHPLEYGDFEGIIPKGQYGGGTVLLWDKGTWEALGNPHEGFTHGKLHFMLHGKKLRGQWALVRMQGSAGGGGKNWLLMKLRDSYSGKKDILESAPRSVKTRRSIKDIADRSDKVWQSDGHAAARHKGSRQSDIPAGIVPQLAVLADHPPEGDQWLHEIKYDGYRLLAFLKDGKVTLRTRTGANWTAKFKPVAQTLAKFPVDSAILDGEAVVLNEYGQSDFQALQQMFKSQKKVNLHYFLFDLLYCDGVDLRPMPLLERKRRLKELLNKFGPSSVIDYSDHWRGDGAAVIKKACNLGAEGIVSKRVDVPYVSRRDATWLKCKCLQRQEFVIIGYEPSKKRTEGFKSLLLGYYDENKRLVYAGRAGTGFNQQTLRDLRTKLQKLEQKTPPTHDAPPPRERRVAQWVKPELVGEIRFSGWTRDGVLRQPAYQGLRLDKPAAQVTREMPLPTANGSKATIASARQSTNGARRRAMATRVLPAQPPALPDNIRLTHPDKILYPADKITKGDLAAYYQSMGPLMLPYVVERPLALVRCPAGLASKCFFMRNWSATLPEAVDKIRIEEDKDQWHILIHDLPGLLGLVQISTLEIHTWNCHAEDIEHPDQLIFDLDPGPGVTWSQIAKAAEMMRRLLDGLRMPAFLKTSGGKGLHITVPIVPNVNWAQAKSFGKTLAQHAATQSDLFVTNVRKNLRRGKIYIDYLRNGRGATAVTPYGTRARPGAPVSMPIAWEECGKLKSADQFTLANARHHLEKRKADPWDGFVDARVDLAAITLNKLAAK